MLVVAEMKFMGKDNEVTFSFALQKKKTQSCVASLFTHNEKKNRQTPRANHSQSEVCIVLHLNLALFFW